MAEVTFKSLWRKHPTNNSNQLPCRRANGLPTYSNQCAIRIGECMKRGGVAPGQVRGAITCDVHGSDAMHFLRAQEVANALSRGGLDWLGPVEKLRGEDPRKFVKTLIGRRGVIFFQDYWARAGERGTGRASGDHIDLWNGYRTTASWLMEYFSWLGYHGGYDGSRQIWFWEIK